MTITVYARPLRPRPRAPQNAHTNLYLHMYVYVRAIFMHYKNMTTIFNGWQRRLIVAMISGVADGGHCAINRKMH